MSCQSETLSVLENTMGLSDYQKLVDSAGGEDALFAYVVNVNDGEREAYETIKRITESPSSSSSSKSGEEETWTDIIIFFAVVAGLTVGGYFLLDVGISFLKWLF